MTKTLYQRTPDILPASMGDETVMLGISSGKYFGLKGTGQVIWEHLATPVTIDELVDHVRSTYEIDPETCRSDCDAFVARLIAKGLVRET